MLRAHRRAARLTLEQLAEASKVSARTLSDMERGRGRGPQHRTVAALAEALALDGGARKRLIELAREGRLRVPAGRRGRRHRPGGPGTQRSGLGSVTAVPAGPAPVDTGSASEVAETRG
ncbi:helix-turn-helix domain-containing protein [Streptomyces sp. NPDC002698]|uniref:helix-turn-helix domain-containing protein n=1 Tax=Streptomyces sp. NPDC002698 TaxID=3364660 RepID=UPI003681F6F5